jgi:hypothetical protein
MRSMEVDYSWLARLAVLKGRPFAMTIPFLADLHTVFAVPNAC